MQTLRNNLLILLLGIVLVNASTFKIYGLDYTARRINYCPSQAQVNQDMQIINSLAAYVRLYLLVDCNQGVMVLEAIKEQNLPLRVTFGIWLDIYFYAEFPNEYAALQNINNVYGLSKVDSIIVGSETQYRGDFSVDLLISFIGNISTTVKQQMGYPQIQVTTSDVIDSISGLPQLIAAVDYVSYNEFAFWENIAIADAVQHTISRYNNFLQFAQGKQVVISEVGWPTQGDPQGNAVPAAANANTFWQGIVCWAATNNIPMYYFAAFDSLWQQDDDQKHWGLYNEDRSLKSGISLDLPCSPSNGYGSASTGSQATPSPTKASSSTTSRISSSTSSQAAASTSTIQAASSTTSAQAASTASQVSTTASRASTTSQAASTSSSLSATASKSTTTSKSTSASTARATSTIGSTSSTQATSSSTTGFNTCPACGAAACCITAGGNSACYDPSLYSCLKAGSSNQLCGVTTHNGNKYFEGSCNGGCYDSFCYSCSGNSLTLTGNC